jgi:hypothetical protein
VKLNTCMFLYRPRQTLFHCDIGLFIKLCLTQNVRRKKGNRNGGQFLEYIINTFDVQVTITEMVDSCRIFSNSSNVLKVCAGVLGVAFIVHCVGIGTTFWVKHENSAYQSRYHSGLFRSCSCFTFFGETCVCASYSNMAPGTLNFFL